MKFEDAASEIRGSLSCKSNVLINLLCNERIELASKFIKVQWNALYQFARDLINSAAIKQANFRSMYSKLAEHIQQDELLSQFCLLVGSSKKSLSEEHYLVLGRICFTISASILHSIAEICVSEEEHADTVVWKNVNDLSSEGKGKIRYCGAWAVVKVREACKRYIKENAYSKEANVRERVFKEYHKKSLLEVLQARMENLHATTEHGDTLRVTDERQYRTNGLTHLTDKAFMFFMQLEQARVNVINHNALNKFKEKTFCVAERKVLENQDLKLKWKFMFVGLPNEKTCSVTGKTIKINVLIDELYENVAMRYMHMGEKQYLRDYRRDFKWKKQEELRRRVTKKKELTEKRDQRVTIQEIKSDTTDGKVYSHSRLKDQLLKDNRIFTKGRIYKKEDLKLICMAYGIPKKDMKSKETMNAALYEKILNSERFVDAGVFSGY